MEDYQEEIKVDEYLYFEAKARMKYRGEKHIFISEKQGYDHFSLGIYYEIQIGSESRDTVVKISEEEYLKRSKTAIPITRTEGNMELWKEGKCFQFSPDVFLFEPKKPTHVQVSEDELHGYFSNVTVLFKTHRTIKKVVCREGYPTGRVEIRDDGEYIEYYTKDCSTVFRKKIVETTSVIPPVIKERSISITSVNEPTKTSTPPPQTPAGCWQFIITLFQLIFALIGLLYFIGFIALLIFSKLWIPLVMIFLIVLFVWLLRNMGSWLSKVPWLTRSIRFGFRWLLTLLLTLFVIKGVFELFNSNNWESSQKERTRTEYTPTPEPQIEPIVESEDLGQSEADGGDFEPIQADRLRISIQWRDLRDSLFAGTYELNNSDIKSSLQNLKNTRMFTQSQYGALYQKLSAHDSPKMASLYNMLDSIRKANSLSDIQFAQVIVTMVQSQEYVLVLDVGCNEISVRTDSDLQAMMRTGVKCEGNYPYGIKPPVKFASDWKGDCDTRTALLYTIMKHFDYDVAIINSNYYKHSMLGVSLDNAKGSHKIHNGKPYYFWETTSKGFKLGELPTGMRNVIFWNVILN